VRDVTPFAAAGNASGRVVWRISTAPARGYLLADMISPSAQMFYDWAGGLIWVALPPSDDGGAAEIRRAVAKVGGHATLVRAPAAIRAKVDVFQPQDAGNAALSRRLKESFDPKGILNPGRMWAGV
jgi:glycolate oxidase FAD binding subunit